VAARPMLPNSLRVRPENYSQATATTARPRQLGHNSRAPRCSLASVLPKTSGNQDSAWLANSTYGAETQANGETRALHAPWGKPTGTTLEQIRQDAPCR